MLRPTFSFVIPGTGRTKPIELRAGPQQQSENFKFQITKSPADKTTRNATKPRRVEQISFYGEARFIAKSVCWLQLSIQSGSWRARRRQRAHPVRERARWTASRSRSGESPTAEPGSGVGARQGQLFVELLLLLSCPLLFSRACFGGRTTGAWEACLAFAAAARAKRVKPEPTTGCCSIDQVSDFHLNCCSKWEGIPLGNSL